MRRTRARAITALKRKCCIPVLLFELGALRAADDLFIADRRRCQGAANALFKALLGFGLGRRLMSHESVIAALKRLTNVNIRSMVPETHMPHIRTESDRASIILLASLIDNFLMERLKELMPSLN